MDQAGMPKKDRVFPTIIAMLIFSAAYWAIALHTNVYGIAAAGAIFEMLWIPAALCAIIVPVSAFVFFVKKGFPAKYAYLLLTTLLACCILALL
jgi:hypothetical protein